LVVGRCDGFGFSDAFNGLDSVRTMLVMEMVPINEAAGKPIDNLMSALNIMKLLRCLEKL